MISFEFAAWSRNSRLKREPLTDLQCFCHHNIQQEEKDLILKVELEELNRPGVQRAAVEFAQATHSRWTSKLSAHLDQCLNSSESDSTKLIQKQAPRAASGIGSLMFRIIGHSDMEGGEVGV